MINLVQFMRKPNTGNYSVERLYNDVRLNLPDDIKIYTHTNKYFSRGIFKRLIDSIIAFKNQKDVNHITGDVHYLSFFLKRKKTILTIHDCVGLERSKGIKFWLLWFFWYWLPEKRCAKIIVISEATKKQVIQYLGCDPSKVKVIHNNVSDEFTHHSKDFNTENPRILHIGTGDNKNLDRHIEAISLIPCTLVIVGKLSDFHKSTLTLKNINYENYEDISNEILLNEYILCDLLIFASLYEGFGLPIIEAQSVGRPVLTSNIWSMPEVAGEGALIVDPYSIESIREGVKKIINNEGYRNKCIQAGLQNTKRFSSKFVAMEYAKVYRDVYNNITSEKI